MRLGSLATILCSLVSIGMLSAGPGKSIEVKAGLSPFTVYMKGAVRTYYDSKSNIKGISYYSDKGTKYASQSWSYDSYGTVSKKVLTENIGWFYSRESVFSYTYSVTNKVLEESQNYGWNTRTLKYEYDLFGNINTIKAYDGNFFPKKKESVQNHYTINGELSSRVFFNDRGHKTLTQQWIYDSFGRLIQFNTLDGDDRLVWGSRTDYDVSPGCDVETTFNSGLQTTSYIYSYRNDQGLMIERDLRDSLSQVISITMIDYNILNQVTRISDYDSNNVLVGAITTFYDTQARPYQSDYSYQDAELLRDRIKDYLKLAGNDL